MSTPYPSGGQTSKERLTRGSDGRMWAIAADDSCMWVIDPGTMVITTLLLPAADSYGDLVMAAQAFLTLLDAPGTIYAADRVRARTRLEDEIAKARR